MFIGTRHHRPSIGPALIILALALAGCAVPGAAPAATLRQTRFSDQYVQTHRGRVTVEVPEVYELANVALAVTDYGLNSPLRLRRQGDYYQRVLDHFLPYKDHPLLKQINFSDSRLNDWYAFREPGMAYVFDGDRIVHGGVYGRLWGTDLFTKHLAQVEDFARVTGFRQFYRDNATFYQAQVQSYEEKVPVRTMWTWLERHFPNRCDHYHIVFSPLTYASHSQQSLYDNDLSEIVMFVSSPDQYAGQASGPLEEALLSRLLFTEIDYYYTDPVTNRYGQQIKKVVAPLNEWNTAAVETMYGSEVQTFREYVTWGLFLLYAQDTYDPPLADEVTRRVIEQMETGRGFPQFGAFAREWLRLYAERGPGEKADDTMPRLLTSPALRPKIG